MARIGSNIIRAVPHLAAFDEAAEQRMANMPVDDLSIYIVDTVLAAALPHLAEQFHVAGLEGYLFAETEQQKRDLIKKAIELHRYKGTPWAIKEALKSVGFLDAEIVEGSQVLYDGVINYNGELTYGDGHWATFRVFIDVGEDREVSAANTALARQLIEEYKNVRSRLIDVVLRSTFVEAVPASDEMVLEIDVAFSSRLAGGLDYNAEGNYNGTYTHNRGRDELDLKVLQNGSVIIGETI